MLARVDCTSVLGIIPGCTEVLVVPYRPVQRTRRGVVLCVPPPGTKSVTTVQAGTSRGTSTGGIFVLVTRAIKPAVQWYRGVQYRIGA